MKEKRTIRVGGATYGDRELSQLIRRRMISRVTSPDRTKYIRKVKHKKSYGSDE